MDINIFGGVVDLTAQQLADVNLNFYGAVTGKALVVFPQGMTGLWNVTNGTSADFVLGYAAQPIPLSIAKGSTVAVYANGSSITVAPPSNSVAQVLPPAVSPAIGRTYLSSSLAKLQAPSSAAERYPLGIPGQEQSDWIYNNTYYKTFTNGLGNIALVSCPVSADPTAAALFYGTVSGSTLTVTQTGNIPPVNTGSPIQPGMNLQVGTGAIIQPYGTGGTTGTGGVGTYALSASPGTIANPLTLAANYWSVPTVIIGGGNGGVSGTVAHSHTVSFDGITLYNYFVATSTAGGFTTQNTYVSTASIAAPTVWTANSTPVLAPQGAGNGQGNVGVIKVGSTYYMTQEFLVQNNFPVEGTASTFQTGLFSCATPDGTFTQVIAQIASLRPTANGSVSHVRLFVENGLYVAYYHAQTWGRLLPSDLFRATNTDITKDSWVITNNGAPFMRRKHAYEVDQLADPSLLVAPGGAAYMYYSACDNKQLNFQLMVAPLFPTLQQSDGSNWKMAQAGYDEPTQVNNDWRGWNKQINPVSGLNISSQGAWTPTAISGAITPAGLVSDGVQNSYFDFVLGELSPAQYELTYTYQTNSGGGIITSLLSDDTDVFNYTLTTTANLLLSSNLFTAGNWTSINTSVTSNNITGPFGATDGSTITATATNNGCRTIAFYSNITAGAIYTGQCQMKAGTVNGYLAFVQAGVLGYAQFNLSNGTVQATSGTGFTATIKPGQVSGWYICTLTGPAATSASLNLAIGPQDNSGTSSGYPKNNTASGSVGASRAMLELGSSASNYVPTTTQFCDTYSASPVNDVQYKTTFTILGTETFVKKLRLKMASKNGSSSGYGLTLQGLSLQRLTF